MTAVPGPVLVTGASGFIGRHLCAHLAARGQSVRALLRPAAAVPEGVRDVVRCADIADERGLADAVRGAGAVVHLAARVHVMHPATAADGEYARVNVEATRRLLDAAVRAGVTRMVLASSVKAVGESSGAGFWSDTTRPAPGDAYGRSKLEAERLLAARARAGDIEGAALRLPLVYGPGAGGNLLRLFRLVESGLPLPFGGASNRRSVLYVGNAVAAISTLLATPGLRGEAFFVADDAPLSTEQLVRLIARALGRPARVLPASATALRLLGRLADAAAPLVRLPVRSADVDRLIGSLAVDDSALRARTGFRPPFTTEQGLARTAEWHRARRAGRQVA